MGQRSREESDHPERRAGEDFEQSSDDSDDAPIDDAGQFFMMVYGPNGVFALFEPSSSESDDDDMQMIWNYPVVAANNENGERQLVLYDPVVAANNIMRHLNVHNSLIFLYIILRENSIHFILSVRPFGDHLEVAAFYGELIALVFLAYAGVATFTLGSIISLLAILVLSFRYLF